MDFNELIHTRRSVRDYTTDPVPRDSIDRCVDAARLAPSAHNAQPCRFVVVDDQSSIERIGEATTLKPSKMNRFVATSPALVVLVLDSPGSVVQIAGALNHLDYPLLDAGIAAEHFCLQATELGLGTCIIGWFNARRIRGILNIPRSKRPVLVITIGTPAPTETSRRPRKSIEQIRAFDTYSL